MADSSHGLRLSMTDLLLRNTRTQGRTCILGLVSRSRAAVGDPLELLGVLHSIGKAVMVAVYLLMMMRLKITELSIGRGRALIENQMTMIVLMMSRRHLQFNTHLREDCQLIASTLVCLRYIALQCQIMLIELITREMV